jgi:hypothetical protein
MRFLLPILFLCASTHLAFAQEIQDSSSTTARCSYYLARPKDPDSSIALIDRILDSKKVTYKGHIASLYSQRAGIQAGKYYKLLNCYYVNKGTDTTGLSIFKRILIDYDKAFDTCQVCQPIIAEQRVEFLGLTRLDTNKLHSDWDMLLGSGWRLGRRGVALGTSYAHHIDNEKKRSDWINWEISAVSYMQRREVIRNLDTTDHQVKRLHKQFAIGYSFFTGSYGRSLNTGSYEVSVSPFRVNAPLVCNLGAIGFSHKPGDTKVSWFYRLEVGLGNSWLFVGYSLQFPVIKNEEFTFFVRAAYPLIKFRDQK